MLQNKNAVIYGAGGSLGGAVAKALASAGARVFLTGRSVRSIQQKADEIIASGGRAEVDKVDSLDEKAIQRHLESVIQRAGTVDISFNGYSFTAGFAPACCALESFSGNLASELGVYGVRVLTMRSAGSPDSRVFKEARDSRPEVMEPLLRQMEDDTMLKKLPMMAEIANLAVFLSSDLAGTITGVTVDATCGTSGGLNYKVPRV